MRTVALATAALIGGSTLAFAAGPPSYDMAKVCRVVAGNEPSLSQMSYQGCMEAERTSYGALRRRWSSIPESIRKDCLSTEQALGADGSYSGLQSCIDGEILYARWKKNHPDNTAASAENATAPVPGRTGTTRRGGSGPGRVGSSGTAIDTGSGAVLPPGTGLGTTGINGLGGTELGNTGIGTTGAGTTGLATPGVSTPGLGGSSLGTPATTTPGAGMGSSVGSGVGAGSVGTSSGVGSVGGAGSAGGAGSSGGGR